MSFDSRDLHLVPPPKSISTSDSYSDLSAFNYRNLRPTREQQQDLPAAVSLIKETSKAFPDQGYRLNISKSQVEVRASTVYGWHCGLQTLKQIATASKDHLPVLQIEDHPDFEHRGIMLDVSRNKVPKLETLYYLIDLFSSWKINELQLYIEHAFAYEGHETVWEHASPLTREDIHNLDTYCSERFIELVPNLNCFGHMSLWLVRESYNHLAEQPDGGNTDLGYREVPQGLCPVDPGSIKLAEDLIRQMTSCFQSNRINVGCDETIDLGYGRSKEAVESRGRGAVYLDYLKQVHAICESQGKRMQFWADIILRYPELLDEVPANGTALNWGYESIHPFEKETELLGSSETEFYVCPGTSSWNSLGGRTENMLGNIQTAARCGVKNGAVGFMVTDWGDNGHLQPLVSSFPGFIYASSQAWHQDAAIELAPCLDTYVFKAQGWGDLILALGDLDKPLDVYIHNQSALFKILHEDEQAIRNLEGLEPKLLETALSQALSSRATLSQLAAEHPTDSILAQECRWVSEMLIHACKRGLSILNGEPVEPLVDEATRLRSEHKVIWHERNRSGGYRDSRKFFDRLIDR